MASYLSSINLNQNEIRNSVIQNLASAPTSPKNGQIYYNTSSNTALQWNGTVWQPFDATQLVGVIPIAALAVNPLARANQTGTQTSSTISDLSTVVHAYTLDSFAAPVSSVNFNTQRLTNVAAPVSGTDAVNLSYLQSQIQSAAAGIAGKGSVVAVATGNIATMSGTAVVVDGITLSTVGMRVLLTGQTTASQNGPWVVASGAWTRPTTDNNNELETGALWFVEQGTVYASSQWWLNSPTAGTTITPGTTSVGIVQYNASTTYTASNGIQKIGSTFSGVVVASGGLTVAAGGFAVDSTIVARKQSQTITGTGSQTTFSITHTLGVTYVEPTLFDSTGNIAYADYQCTGNNALTVTFGSAPANATTYTLLMIG